MPSKRPLQEIINETTSMRKRQSGRRAQNPVEDDEALTPPPANVASDVDPSRNVQTTTERTDGESSSQDRTAINTYGTSLEAEPNMSIANSSSSHMDKSPSASDAARNPDPDRTISSRSCNASHSTDRTTQAENRSDGDEGSSLVPSRSDRGPSDTSGGSHGTSNSENSTSDSNAAPGSNSSPTNPDGTIESESAGSSSSTDLSPLPFEDAMVEYDADPEWNGKLRRRISALLKYYHEGDQIYSISRLPQRRLAWGESENKQANKLCIRGQHIPVSVWIVAFIYRLYMFEPDGSLKKKVSMAMLPLSEHSLQAAFRILTNFSKPQEDVDPSHRRIYASCWQTSRVPGQREVKIDPFTACYDATRSYQTKSKMSRIDVVDLKEGDLVLVEAHISRFSTSEDPVKYGSHRTQEKGKVNKKKGFTEWKSMFELGSISLLKEGPDLKARPAASTPADCSDVI